MTETKEAVLERLFPDYEKTRNALESYSDYELSLIRDDCPEYPEDLEDLIIMKVQWSISETLFRQLINNWNDFFLENENLIRDYCFGATFIGYNRENNSYWISRKVVIGVCKDLLCEADVDYSINEDIDFRDIISDLNKYYPIKFCEE